MAARLDFLIIGAMRAGTTTLFEDLRPHPDLFLPEHKEPEYLCSDEVLADGGAKAYGRLFRHARADQLCGEASTAYTKAPHHAGVPARARRVAGEGLKLVYIVREPVARARSQHHHEIGQSWTNLPIDRAMREEPRFLDVSRYAMQLDLWLEHFDPANLMILRFEDYVAARDAQLAAVCRFLGVDPARLPPPSEEAFNKTAGRPSTNRFWRRFVHGQVWYEEYVKPYVPRGLRRRAAAALLPQAPAEAEALAPATVAYMVEALGADTERFERLFETHQPDLYRAATRYDPVRRYASLLERPREGVAAATRA
jgi:hypothetical protein